MSEQERSFYAASLQNVAQVQDLIGRLFRVAEPGAIYSEPIVAGDRTIIVTSEISMSIGAGVGFGQPSTPPAEDAARAGITSDAGLAASSPPRGDVSGGGGGGGFSFGRPVAAVIIEPSGVRVEPIVDPTKLGIAFFTTLGAMFFAWTSLRRTTKELAAHHLAADTRAASRAAEKSATAAAKNAAKEARLAAQLAAREAGAGVKHAAKLAAKEAKKAAKEVAKDAAKLAAKQAA